jgi:hypothetical protein
MRSVTSAISRRARFLAGQPYLPDEERLIAIWIFEPRHTEIGVPRPSFYRVSMLATCRRSTIPA